MRKLILLLIAAALLLFGCGRKPSDAVTTVPSTGPTEAPTEATGLYEPGSPLELQTSGAVKCYPLDGEDYYGVVATEKGLVLFSGAGETTLTILTGRNLTPVASAQLGCRIYPDDPGVQISDSGLGYYDGADRAIVFLDSNLQESSRIRMPEDISGSPALASDLRTIYYCVANQVRILDVQSGISRLLKQQNCISQSVTGIFCDDSVLRCRVELTEGRCTDVFISTENGQTLYSGNAVEQLHTYGSSYFAEIRRSSVQELVFGMSQSEKLSLQPPEHNTVASPVLNIGGTVIVDQTDSDCSLSYYDLNSGLRTAWLELPASKTDIRLESDPGRSCLWFLFQESGADAQLLCSWDATKSAVTDHVIYAGTYHTAQTPDTEGLSNLEAEAQRIGQEYDVNILLWNDSMDFEPSDYHFEPEFLVRAYEQSLVQLENALSRFPEGFLKKTAEQSDCGEIRIALVRAIYGDQKNGTLDQKTGLQYWLDGDACIALVLGDGVEQNFYHELFHIIETRVYATAVTYDDWNKLNPSGFEYDYDYVANLQRQDEHYLEGANRSFIDIHSMSFPREDRARIMEYAMIKAGEDCFTSNTMQRKLKQLCLGIRKAYGLQKCADILPWEQYLEEPLTP